MYETYTECFEDTCPYYMAIGMGYDEFWEAPAERAIAYRKAHELRNAADNQYAWLQGLYDYKAFTSVVGAFAWGLGGRKGKKPDGYFTEPLSVTDYEKEREKARRVRHTLDFFKKGQEKGRRGER